MGGSQKNIIAQGNTKKKTDLTIYIVRLISVGVN
jgi:hypothetical protein